MTVHVASSTPAGSTISNTASVTSSTSDPNPANDSATAQTAVVTTADLSVTKSGPISTPPNSTAVYTITVKNNGPSDATNVTLSEVVPAGTTFAAASETTG